MKLDLQSLTTAMGQAAAAVASSQQFAAQLYTFGARMIVNAEQAYGAAGAGAHKRAAVLAAVGALETSLAAANPGSMPSIMSEFTPWLETVIGAYNAIDDALGAGLPHAPTLGTIEKAASAIEQTAERVVTETVQLFKTAPPAPTQVPAANTQGV